MEDVFDGYKKLFEVGLYNEDPAIRVIDDFTLCPTSLAALVTALFETVIQTVPDSKQIDFEEQFNNSFNILMQERAEYDVCLKYPDDEI